jgi:NarL family two-component system sensor histidine kinase LiaS
MSQSPTRARFQVAPLSASALRRYAWMRWVTLAAASAITVLSAIHLAASLPAIGGLILVVCLYIGLVQYQYRRGRATAARQSLPPWLYLILSDLLIFGMMLLPGRATYGTSLWYCVMFFVVMGESRHLQSIRSVVALIVASMACTYAAMLLSLPAGDWLSAGLGFVPLCGGLIATALGGRIERDREAEHAARLALLEELARSRDELEEANARLLAFAGTVEQLAVANERNRVARDLHDILGYTLATVVVKAEAAKRLLQSDAARVSGELDRIQEVARSGLAEVRRSIAGLRDAAPGQSVWHEATTRFIEDLAREQGLVITAAIAPLPEGHDPRLEITLFRVIQEALTNVVRHAQAHHAWVRLQTTDQGLELTIEDDGMGMGPSTSAPGGFGLRGMRERVELLDGRLSVASRRGEGTRITALLPVTACTGTVVGASAPVPDDVPVTPLLEGSERR